MNTSIERLRAVGQSLWLDNITRAMLGDGTLARYISELSVTGLTSNPTIFEQAIAAGAFYDEQIADLARKGRSGEELFFALALRDLTRAADLFRPIHAATGGSDGWVSLEVSPLLADDTGATIEAALRLHAAAQRTNLYIKIPGTPAGIPAIEESIFSGVPINVTLLFSREHYRAAAEAYLRGIERRIAAGRDPRVESVASLFVSRWDVAANDKLPPEQRNRLGIAIARRTYRDYRELLAAPRWNCRRGRAAATLLGRAPASRIRRARHAVPRSARGARHREHVPETLKAFADHGRSRASCSRTAATPRRCSPLRTQGIDDAALAERLQREGAAAFTKSWQALLTGIAAKVAQLAPVQP
jgi:transaldolase